MEYIEDQSVFESFIERANRSPILAIDTEFMREKTYYAKLCLLQMATDDEVVIVDPFKMKDLHVLGSVLENLRVVKLLHSGRQDIEILLREVGCTPVPVFDTQIAAALLGQSHQAGFGSLVHAFLGVTLKKADSFTDWSRRPLTRSQLEYAADDVVYLPELYHTMHTMLEKEGRTSWLDDDFAELSNPMRYISDPNERFRRLKRGNQLNPQQLSAAKEVTAWREREAERRNVPRKWIMSDEEIVEACKREALTLDELFMVRTIKGHVSTRDARKVLELIAKGLNAPEEEWPKQVKPSGNEVNVDAPLDLMMAIVHLRAKENGIAVQTLASHDDLVALARGNDEESSLAKGWRKSVVGNELKRLLAGELALSLDGTELNIQQNV